MKIYHGSKYQIQKPIVKGSNQLNDYGPSFYLTLDIEAAKAWACKQDEIGGVNTYIVRKETFDNLKILDLTDKSKYSVLNWLAILMHFREVSSSLKIRRQKVFEWLEKYYIDVEQYDVVIGYRADDSYFRFPLAFINDSLAYEDLENVFMLGQLGVQYAFMSEKAIKSLKFESFTPCDNVYLRSYHSIVIEANKKFDEFINKPIDPKKTYATDLVRRDYEQ